MKLKFMIASGICIGLLACQKNPEILAEGVQKANSKIQSAQTDFEQTEHEALEPVVDAKNELNAEKIEAKRKMIEASEKEEVEQEKAMIPVIAAEENLAEEKAIARDKIIEANDVLIERHGDAITDLKEATKATN